MSYRPAPSHPSRPPRWRTLRSGVLSVLLLLALVACGTTEPSGPATAPDLTIDAPTDGAIVDDPSSTVEGRATHPNGVVEVVATIGGREVACDQDGSAFACDVSPLSEGVNTIVVTATGGDGGTATARIDVTYEAPDTGGVPPEIAIEAPEDDAVFTEPEVVVQGTATHPIGVERVDATLDTETTDCSTFGNGFACTVALTIEGTNAITVAAVGSDGGTSTRTVQIVYEPSGSEPEGTFELDLVFHDHEFEPHHIEAIRDAARRWEEVIVGDLQDVTVDFAEDEACGEVFPTPAFSGTIDDVQVYVTTGSFTSDATLGAAGPCRVRSGGDDPWTTFVGVVELNATRIEELHVNGTLIPTMVHELGHVLGFGTQWETTLPTPDLIEYEATDGTSSCREVADGFASPPVYTGTHGMDAYIDLGGSGPVPVEDTGGPGTQCGHWDEAAFDNELMTGFLNSGVPNPLSELSIEAMRDLGFEVDPSAADPYTLPDPLSLHDHEHGLDIASNEIVFGPMGAIDMETGELIPLDAVPPRHGEHGSEPHDHD